MAKLFIKLWLFLLATSFGSFQIQTRVFEWTTAQQHQERQRAPFLTTTAELVAHYMRDIPQSAWPAQFLALEGKLTYHTEIVALSNLQSLGISSETIQRIRDGEAVYFQDQKDQSITRSIGCLRIGNSEYAITSALPPYQPLLLFRVLTPRTFAWLTESLLYGSAVLLWLSLFWRDLKRVMHAAGAVGNGELDSSLSLSKGSALAPLAASFNQMTARIAGLLRSHKELTSAVSHELRTPLARLRFALSLSADTHAPDQRDELIRNMHRDVNELDQLTDELLVYSRLDRDAPPLQLGLIRVDSWLPRVIEDELAASHATGIDIPIHLGIQVEQVHGETKYLARAVANLIRNALRFAKTRVDIGVSATQQGYEIVVADDGPGIDPAFHEALFTPFARTDQSRNRVTGGCGLGLAIVKRVAERYSGNVQIATDAHLGTRIVMRWPTQPVTATQNAMR